MNEELNTDEFESWLKNQADKHRMYPSDQLWRNINQQLHGNRRWPALTFGAILTGALVTASLIFLRPDKDLFNLPITVADNSVSVKPLNSKTNVTTIPSIDVKALQPLKPKEVVYSFNSPVSNQKKATLQTLQKATPSYISPDDETLALNEPTANKHVNAAPALTSSVNVSKPVVADIYGAANSTSEPEIDDRNTDLDEVITKEQKAVSTISLTEEEEQDYTADKAAIRLPENKKSRWSVELYGGPNINYRRLTEKQPFDYHLPYNAALTANNRSVVNNVVKQRPSVGFNVGTALVYSISDRLKVKAGLQFNYRQYTIDAFRSKLERSVLLLDNGYIYPDSVYTFSVISNEPGKSAITLNNRYFQLSAPVTVEWTVAKVNKLSFNLASSVQPTYQLNTNMYQITSDYKSYVQAPGLLRRWNINAGAEATANFMAGGLQWQVGPQIRYQMLPTQVGNYSIREHLIDYGVKVGIIKQLF
jgi:hypothetical protein